MNRKIIVHVGMPKCGSSALQARLASNRDRLFELGVLYPSLIVPNPRDPATTIVSIGHMKIVAELCRAALVSPALESAVQIFRAGMAHTMIVSSESFVSKAHRIEKSSIPEFLYNCDVEIVCFFKRHDEWVTSRYKQIVRTVGNRFAGEITEMLNNPPKGLRNTITFNLVAQLDALIKILNPTRCHIINLDTCAVDAISAFDAISGLSLSHWKDDAAHVTGYHAANLIREQPINASMSNLRTMFLVECTRRGLSAQSHLALMEPLLDLFIDEQPSRLLTLRQSRKLLRTFSTVNADLESRYGVRVDGSPPLGDDVRPVQGMLADDEWRNIATQLTPSLESDARAEITSLLALR